MSSAYNLIHNNPEQINIALYSSYVLLLDQFLESKELRVAGVWSRICSFRRWWLGRNHWFYRSRRGLGCFRVLCLSVKLCFSRGFCNLAWVGRRGRRFLIQWGCGGWLSRRGYLRYSTTWRCRCCFGIRLCISRCGLGWDEWGAVAWFRVLWELILCCRRIEGKRFWQRIVIWGGFCCSLFWRWQSRRNRWFNRIYRISGNRKWWVLVWCRRACRSSIFNYYKEKSWREK